MAVSYDTWRRTHGFSEADAPSSDEVAIRMVIEKGQISPELTEALLGAIAPDVLEKIHSAQQVNSPAPVPPEVQQALQGLQPQPQAQEEETPIDLIEPPADVTPPAPEEGTGL
jgi:hypothetical protein